MKKVMSDFVADGPLMAAGRIAISPQPATMQAPASTMPIDRVILESPWLCRVADPGTALSTSSAATLFRRGLRGEAIGRMT
ncbi:MAG TPA: hypothetical protein VL654_15285 [Casimicrobiaceae bacterium]|nr:hypothetical protein [Casimicrobiaceae bacterium]